MLTVRFFTVSFAPDMGLMPTRVVPSEYSVSSTPVDWDVIMMESLSALLLAPQMVVSAVTAMP